MDDPDLVAEVAAAKIPLEVCPTSNVLLGLVGDLSAHPLPRMVAAGLTVTLNTDGETTLAGEYEVARSVFGFDDAALAALAIASARASFASEQVKREIVEGAERWLSTGL